MERGVLVLGMISVDNVLLSLKRSKFRSSFHLKEKDILYARKKGYKVIEEHAYDFIGKRLAPMVILNDGKQTPMKGHPVFIAQHATGTCCRGCLEKWHNIPKGRTLSISEQNYIVKVIMTWITNEVVKK